MWNPDQLHATRHDLPVAARAKVVALCNLQLADAVDLQTQLKQAHWNVRGPNFRAVHELFDEICEEVEHYVDQTAERIVQLAGVALGTVRWSAGASRLPEYPPGASTGGEHLSALAIALAAFGRSSRAAIDAAEACGDKATADMFTEIVRGVDGWLWMVEAHLPGET